MMAASLTSKPGKPLQGSSVLVTRAASQNAKLLERVLELGGEAIAAPCLGIRFVNDGRKREELLDSLQWADAAVFTSANAVEAVARMDGLGRILAQLELWCVGASTKQALAGMLGDGVVVGSPERGAGAEAMLGLEGLRALQGRKMLLLRGAPSLGNILPRLAERGADVREHVLYASHSIRPNLEEVLSGGATVDAVMVGSIGALRGLMASSQDPRWRQLPDSTLMIAASERIAAEARQQGWRRVAASERPDDEGMVETLLGQLGETLRPSNRENC